MKYRIEQWFPDSSLENQGEWREIGSSSSRITALHNIFDIKKDNPGIFYRIVCVLALY